jgi:hypothetical protein
MLGYERRLLADVLHPNPNVQALQRTASYVSDPEALIQRAHELAILPPVATRIVAVDAHRAWPTALQARLERDALESATNNTLRLHQAAEVSARLDAHGIPALFVKGAALLADTYQDIGARHLDDIDVIVPADEAARARTVLLEAGFTDEERFEAIAVDGRPLAEHASDDHHAEVGLRSPLGVAVDLHRQLADTPNGRFEQLVVGSRLVPIPTGGTIRVAAPEVELRILCHHVIVHHDMVARYIPRHLFDVAALLKRWPGIEASGDALVRASVAAVRAVETHPERWGALILPSRAIDRATDTGAYALRVAERSLRQLATDPARLARKVFPTPAFVAATYGTTPRDPRLPALYAHRLLTLRFLRHREGA